MTMRTSSTIRSARRCPPGAGHARRGPRSTGAAPRPRGWTVLAAWIAVMFLTCGGALPTAHAADEVARAASARMLLETRPLRALDGTSWRLSDHRGEVVVVNFWASWCAPCRKELPALDALNREIASHGGQVLAISIDADADNARRFVRAQKLSLPVMHDGPDGLARLLDLDRIPYTLVLDRSGAVAYVGEGAEARNLNNVVLRLLDRPAASIANTGGAR